MAAPLAARPALQLSHDPSLLDQLPRARVAAIASVGEDRLSLILDLAVSPPVDCCRSSTAGEVPTHGVRPTTVYRPFRDQICYMMVLAQGIEP